MENFSDAITALKGWGITRENAGALARLNPGDESEDVRRLRQVLNFFGANLPEGNRYDEATIAAVDDFREQFLDDPETFLDQLKRLVAEYVFRLAYGKSPEEVIVEVSGQEADVAPLRVDGLPDGLADEGIDRAYSERYRNQSPGAGQGALAANLASRYLGRREEGGNNRGAIINTIGGVQGQHWCGYFANYIYDQAMPGLFTQPDHARALSFRDFTQQIERETGRDDLYRARNEIAAMDIEAGDTIVFDRGGRGRGHVGIITAVTADSITYISGNDGNAVKARTISRSSLPANVLGIVDVSELADARGLSISGRDLPVATTPGDSIMNATSASAALAAQMRRLGLADDRADARTIDNLVLNGTRESEVRAAVALLNTHGVRVNADMDGNNVINALDIQLLSQRLERVSALAA